MSKASPSVAETRQLEVYYHPGVFTPKKNVVLAVAGLAALTALAIGIIALLHSQGIMNAGPFNVIPNYGAYILLGGAGVYAIALTAMAIQHKHRHDWSVSFVERTKGHLWEREFQRLKSKGWEWDAASCLFDGKAVYGIIAAEGNSQSIHLYINEEERDAYLTQKCRKE